MCDNDPRYGTDWQQFIGEQRDRNVRILAEAWAELSKGDN